MLAKFSSGIFRNCLYFENKKKALILVENCYRIGYVKNEVSQYQKTL